MKFLFDEELVEASVLLCASGKRSGVPPLQVCRLNAARDRLYSILDPDERNAAFFRLHAEWFRVWGLEKLLRGVAGEFPLLAQSLTLLAFRKARTRTEEGAELYVNAETGRHGVVAMRPERCESDDGLSCFLRHELTHVHDMVNAAFGYSPDIALSGFNTARQRLARERYRLLWDITIDGRLVQKRQLPDRLREKHQHAFDRAYCFWPDKKRAQVFEGLWTDPAPEHAKLLALASDPQGLSQSHEPLPGAPCPLCSFPTFAWADVTALSPSLAVAIQTEFPEWTAAMGVCRRCVETYDAATKYRVAAAVVSGPEDGERLAGESRRK